MFYHMKYCQGNFRNKQCSFPVLGTSSCIGLYDTAGDCLVTPNDDERPGMLQPALGDPAPGRGIILDSLTADCTHLFDPQDPTQVKVIYLS